MPIDTDYVVLRNVLNGIRSGLWPGVAQPAKCWAAEFGVYSGYSLRLIAERMPVIGFDSFEGLPEDWRPGFPKGKFAFGTNLPVPPGGLGPNRMVVPGWFEDTVPNFPFPPLGLVHVDCDLYSSTVTVLDGVLPYIDEGTVIVFDEFEGVDFDDEKRAWTEWLDRHSVNATLLAHKGEEAAFVIESIGGSS